MSHSPMDEVTDVPLSLVIGPTSEGRPNQQRARCWRDEGRPILLGDWSQRTRDVPLSYGRGAGEVRDVPLCQVIGPNGRGTSHSAMGEVLER
jgi:hypothetical protein